MISEQARNYLSSYNSGVFRLRLAVRRAENAAAKMKMAVAMRMIVALAGQSRKQLNAMPDVHEMRQNRNESSMIDGMVVLSL